MFSRGSRLTIRPIELGRRVVREMDDQRSVDVNGRRVVPNHFVVKLSQKDYDGFASIKDVLVTELVEAAREYARAENYHFLGPVAVQLEVDDAAKPGRFDIAATLRQANIHPPAPSMPAAAAPPAMPGVAAAGAAVPPAPVPTPAADDDFSAFAPTGDEASSPPLLAVTSRLVLPNGQQHTLGDEVVSIGRVSENTLPVADQNVSRRHAEIRPNRNSYVVVDLGSTNGTLVNGTRIHGETVLSDGDVISLGTTYIRFESN